MTLRCAIYTRVSTEHGLDQEFNSLDNQREAAEAFIKSQAHEGWRLVRDRFDDGGFSGGSTDRPALQRLLADIGARGIDVVVVYKVDRLTRSLADFAKLVELFDAHSVSFVSVTQAFNTTTSMGRLTLNVLLSFAQFEREVTGERIRDKIAASKRKGIWMGGNVPLGYAASNRRLVIVPDEAEQVRSIFERYLALGSLTPLLEELRERGIITKRSCHGDRVRGGIPFTRGPLAYLLRNRSYVGEIALHGSLYPGEHTAIVARELFDAVQQRLASQAASRSDRHGRSGALLLGLIHDDRGHRMSPTHALKAGKRYRYYTSCALQQGQAASAGSVTRVPAPELERLVLAALRPLQSPERMEGDLVEVLERVTVHPDRLTLILKPDGERRSSTIEVPWCKPKPPARIVIAAPTNGVAPRPLRSERRATLLIAIAKGRLWLDEILSGAAASADAIAAREGISRRQVNATLSLAFTAPEIVQAAIAGTLPQGLTLRQMIDPPPLWSQQHDQLGIG